MDFPLSRAGASVAGRRHLETILLWPLKLARDIFRFRQSCRCQGSNLRYWPFQRLLTARTHFGGTMINFTSIRQLTLGFLLFLPALCHAHGCKIETATAPLHVAVGTKQGCLQKVEVKVCVPHGKTLKSQAVRGLSATPNVDVSTEVKDAGGCVVGVATVQARNVVGPSFLEYCAEGAYDGRVEVTYCH